MKIGKSAPLFCLAAALFASSLCGCGRGGGKLAGEADSLSYVIGLNVAHNLIRMDSTLNIDAVCLAIRDVYAGRARMSMEEARTYYLAQKTYFVHEKAMAYQEQFLSDLSRKDRSYVRTRTGVTYKIIELGDQSIQNMSVRDTVLYAYTLTDDTGRVIVDSDTLRTAYRQLPDGLQEVVRIAGDKGSFDAWLPSSTAYDTAGNAELGVGPDQLLNYRVDIIRIDYYNASSRR